MEAPEEGVGSGGVAGGHPTAVALECEKTSLALGSTPSHTEEAQMVPQEQRGTESQNVIPGKALELREASCRVEG